MQISALALGASQPAGCCSTSFNLDTPHTRSATEATPYTRALGHVLGASSLANVRPGDATSPVMVRANNMASLVTSMLLQFKPEHREEMLTSVAGLNWTSQVLKLARSYPGATGISDAVRFSLALHFLLGVTDADAGKNSLFAQGDWSFKSVLERARGAETDGGSGGLSGLGRSSFGQLTLSSERITATNTTLSTGTSTGTSTSTSTNSPPPPPSPSSTSTGTYPPPPVSPTSVAVQPSTTNMPTGNVDSLSTLADGTNVIRGWVCRRGNSTEQLTVQAVTAEGARIPSAVGVASVGRESAVAAACGVTGTSNYGFELKVSPQDAKTFAGKAVRIVAQTTPQYVIGGLIPNIIGPPEAPTGPMLTATATANYPAPPDIPALNLEKFQVANCGALGFDGSREDKVKGVTATFRRIFERAPNKAEVQYYGEMRWCAGTVTGEADNSAMGSVMIRVRDAIRAKKVMPSGRAVVNTTPARDPDGPVTDNDFSIRTLASDMSASIEKAAAVAFTLVGQAKDFIFNALCQGFKELFGPVIGGVLCDVLNVVLNAVGAQMLMGVAIIQDAVQGLLEFINNMVLSLSKGVKYVELAFIALLKAMGRMMFSISSPITVPLLMGKGTNLVEGFRDLREKADRVTARNPLFPLMLITAVVSVVLDASAGTIVAPPFTSITALILALSPMFAVFMAPELRKLQVLAKESLDTIERGIEKFLKFAIIIFQGVININAVLATLKAQLIAYFKKKVMNETGRVDAGKVAELTLAVLSKLGRGIQLVAEAFRSMNFKDISQAALPLLTLIPELLLALLPDADMEIPALSDWIAGAKAAAASVEEQEANLRMGAEELLGHLTLGARVDVLRAQSEKLEMQQQAAVAAHIIGVRYKNNRAQHPAFMAALKVELLKI